ncbi:hypothetical protein EVG20_g8980, partial [Dentipellis fragilis]
GVGVVAEWWRRERVSKLAEIALPHRDTDALIIEALSYLVCASLAEDRYGVVQRDIPRILEAMLSFLSAVEEYQTELNQRVLAAGASESASAVREEVSAANDVLATVGDGACCALRVACSVIEACADWLLLCSGLMRLVLKEGVVRVVRTFGE